MDEPYGAKFLKNYSPQLVLSESDDDESEVSDDEAQQLKDNIFLVSQRQRTCANESRELFQSRRFEKDANASEDFCGFEKFVFKNFFANFMKIETSGVLDFTVFAARWNRDFKELAPDFGTGVFCKLCFFIKHSLLLPMSDGQKLDFAVDCAMWNDFFLFFQKGRWCKAAFPYTVPSTDASLLSTDGSKYRRISSHGS